VSLVTIFPARISLLSPFICVIVSSSRETSIVIGICNFSTSYPAVRTKVSISAIKVAALVTVLMGIPLKPQEVDREGVRNITPEMVSEALKEGKRYKLICSAERDGDKIISAKVAPELIPSTSPIYSVEASSTVELKTDVLGDLSIVEKILVHIPRLMDYW
jgi:hypothetical protein